MKPDTPPPTRSALAAAIALALGALCSCGKGAPPPGSRPLFDGRTAPTVRVEGGAVLRPPAARGDRFLAGWRPWRDGDRIVLTASPDGARLQVVELEARPRRLALDLLAAPGDGLVQVRAAGRPLGRLPLRDPLVVRLPADLPVGTVDIEVTPVGDPPPALNVVAARVTPAHTAGEARLAGPDLVQTGWSRVEVVRRAPPGSEFRGTFLPPANPRPGQAFTLSLATPAPRAHTARFAWRAEDGSRSRPIRLRELPGGLVRVVLEARGAGPAGRWRHLGWAGRAAEPGGSGRPAPATPRGLPRLVVVYVMDALRADFVGHLGGPPGISPTLDGLASEGFTFRNHHSVAPSTLPSTRSLFSGAVNGVAEKRAAAQPPLAWLPEAFRRAGYRTALFSGNGYVSAAYGLSRGFDHVAQDTYFQEDESGPGYNDNAARVQAAATAWLSTLPSGQRAFLYLHTIHPHNPYDPPPEVRRRFVPPNGSRIDGSTATLLAIRDGERSTSLADRARLLGLYAASFAYNDRELAGFVHLLEARYGRGEVLLVVTSDHGEELFDHGGALHGFTLYEEMLHIPLIFHWPGHLVPGSSGAPTSTLDLHATLVDLVSPHGTAASEGRSLLPLVTAGTPLPDSRLRFALAPNVRSGLAAVEGRGCKLVFAAGVGARWGMGEGPGRTHDPEYLFDLQEDPGETHNRIGTGRIEEAWLRGHLEAWLARRGPAGRHLAPEPEPDPETARRLRALGYLR